MIKTDSRKSLRFKLLVASVVVEVAMLTLLVANSVRLMHASLNAQGIARTEEIRPILNAALSGPIAQRDYGTLQEIINEIRNRNGIAYLVVFDSSNKQIAASGWDVHRQLPVLDTDLNQVDDGYFDAQTQISIAGQTYGVLHYGLSTEFLTVAKGQLLRQSLLIAATEIILSILLLTLIGYWLTRHLVLLIRASEQVALAISISNCLLIRRMRSAFCPMRSIPCLPRSIAAFRRLAKASPNSMPLPTLPTAGKAGWAGRNLVWVNPSVERVTGYSPDECMSMTNFPSCLAVEEDTERVNLACKAALQVAQGEYFEFQLRRKNGQVIWLVVFWQPIYGDQWQPQGIRTSMLDITERKEAEILLRPACLNSSRPMRRGVDP